MRNANDAPWERAHHYWNHTTGRIACGARSRSASSANRRETDCRRCLASLAKADRVFQRKARRGLRGKGRRYTEDQSFAIVNSRSNFAAARAIAAEEGRDQ